MSTDLFERLDADWEVFASSSEAEAALRGWAARAPELAGVGSLDDLLAVVQGRHDPDRRDERLLAMLRFASDDPLARRVVLQAVRPALSSFARTYAGRWGKLDAASTVMVVALERIASFPTERRQTNLAAHIVLDVRRVLLGALRRELTFESVFALQHDLVELEEELVAPPERTAADHVLQVIADAVRSRTITRRHAELVIASRLHGVGTEDLARRWQRDPQTIRRMRQRAERALVRSAVA
jgi:hypothetical protein